MHLHFFSTTEKQFMLHGLWLLAKHVVNIIEGPVTPTEYESDVEELVLLAADIDLLISEKFQDLHCAGCIFLTDDEATIIYEGIVRLQAYANAIRKLWMKGGCLYTCLHSMSLQMEEQASAIINQHFKV